jgi:ribose transport system permease protein
MRRSSSRTEPRASVRWLGALEGAWAWLFLILTVAIFEVWAHIALGRSFVGNLFSLQSIALAATQTFLLAAGQTFVIITGGIDLSVGFTGGLAAVLIAAVINTASTLSPWVSLILAVLLAVFIAGLIGLINGVLITRFSVTPLIATLGTYGVAQGASYLISGGNIVGINNPILSEFGNNNLWIIPIPVLFAALVFLVLHWVLSRSRFGQYTYAIGGSYEAALRAGIDVRRHLIYVYILSAVTAALTGFVYTGRFTAGAPNATETALLTSIAAVVIGGASLFGGEGNLVGTLIGSLIIAVIDFGFVFLGVEPFWQYIAVGLAIILAVIVDQTRRRAQLQRARALDLEE